MDACAYNKWLIEQQRAKVASLTETITELQRGVLANAGALKEAEKQLRLLQDHAPHLQEGKEPPSIFLIP